ncbi:flavodoxin-dependent (E)-4-hydroxy-3-methylbut-2-enyl-diphosphate synthase [Desulfothermus okinawensis JCM 13304]
MEICEIRETKKIYVGGVDVGGGAPIRVQSMTNTITEDCGTTISQIKRLEQVGCEIIRVAVNNPEAAKAVLRIREQINIPLIADVHFDYKLAVLAVENGAHGVRINPGNIGGEKRLNFVIDACKSNNSIIRIGVNSGSLEKDLLKKYQGPAPDALVESGLRWVKKVENRGFYNIKVSLKSSSVIHTIKSYSLFSKKCDYPLHVGITEAGPGIRGAIKSGVGIGIILAQGIGDTIRVSLTGDPTQEVIAGYEILRSLGLRDRGPEIISCPTCARTEIDVAYLVSQVEKWVSTEELPIKVAIMGCVVNGPGEAKEADIGIAGGKELGVIFRKGKVVKKVYNRDRLLEEFKKEFKKCIEDKKKEISQ